MGKADKKMSHTSSCLPDSTMRGQRNEEKKNDEKVMGT